MTDAVDDDPLVRFQGDLVHRSFRDRKIREAREAIAGMRANLRTARSAEDVARERAKAREGD